MTIAFEIEPAAEKPGKAPKEDEAEPALTE